MARSIIEITTVIEAEKNSKPVLAALTSPSAVGLWKLIRDTIAFFIWVLETLFDKHKAEVEYKISRGYYGTLPWYADEAKKFQLGDTLEIIDGVLQYPDSAVGDKIITRATAKLSPENWIYLKVAKDGATPDSFQALSAPELVQFKGYIDRKQPAGVRVEVVSRDADRLKVVADIYYDPMLSVQTVREAVIEAISVGYLKALEFDGEIYRSKIEDFIQDVPGVKDVDLQAITARSGATSYVVGRKYETQSGYIIEEDTPGQAFSDTLNFIPDYAS